MGKYTTFLAYSMHCRKKILSFNRPAVMGILNVTSDSFHDGGRYLNADNILLRAHEIVNQGGDIIDIGAVSTRPGAQMLDQHEEASRLAWAVSLVRNELPQAVISADTTFSLPARKAVEAGADIINDISGGQFDSSLWDTVADLDVPYILGHTRGLPSQMQLNTHYDDLLGDLVKHFSRSLDTLYRKGVKDVILDPCFGFAKTLEQNYFLLYHLDEITSLFNEPLLVGVSRKSMICNRLNCSHEEALNGTTALNTLALSQGARLLRVHDVRQAYEIVSLLTVNNDAK